MSIASRVALTLLSAYIMASAVSGAARAGTATSTFAVTMTITANCVISSTNTLAFGSSGVITANVDATTTLGVQCTNTTPYNIGLDAGTGSGATTTTRKMTGPSSAIINYAMFSDAGRTTNWGNTIGTDTVVGTGSGSSQTSTIYGRVAAQSTPAPGAYSDTVTVTVTF